MRTDKTATLYFSGTIGAGVAVVELDQLVENYSEPVLNLPVQMKIWIFINFVWDINISVACQPVFLQP